MQIEIKQLQRQAGVAAIFVTHDQSEALSLSDRVAVMSAGRIEQIGTPQDIYGSPRSGFVAAFIGETNRVPGTVVAGGPGEIVIEAAGGMRLFASVLPQAEFPKGSRVDIFVRPEDIAIVEPVEGRGNVLRAEVKALSYQGSHTHVIATVDGLGPITVLAAGGAVISRYPVGSAVQLQLDLGRASIIQA